MARPNGAEYDGAEAANEELSAADRWPLAALALAMLLSSLGVSIPNVALPVLTEAFAASFQSVQWVVLAYLLAVTVTIVSAGRLGDFVGHRRVLLAGIVVFTAASLMCGVAPTLWMLIAARAVQGTGAAVLMALTLALVRETVPAARIGSAMGLMGTMSAIGTALGPSLGGVLIAGPGWRAIFLAMIPLGMLAFVLARRHLPAVRARGADGDKGGFDGLGTVLLGLTLAAYALAVTVGRGQFDRLSAALLLAALLGGGLFVLAEARAASPLIRLSAFRHRMLSISLAMNALVATVMMATLVVGPFCLFHALGLNEAIVGLVMSVGPAISALSGVPSGRVVDRWGASRTVVAGLVAVAAGSILLALLPPVFGIAGYIAAIAVLTPGYQLFQAANNTAVMMDVGMSGRGVASGMLSLARNLGLITGASVMGAVYSFASQPGDATTSGPEAATIGLQVTFTVAAGLIVAALAMAVAGRLGGAGGKR